MSVTISSLERLQAISGTPISDMSSMGSLRGLDAWYWTLFVGYAPVLAAMASFVDVPNEQAATNEIKARRVSENLWIFLAGLVKTVLKREQKKTVSGLKATLAPTAETLGWSDWDVLYRE